MNLRKTLALLLSLSLALVLFSACNEAPEDVKGDMSAIDDVHSKTNIDDDDIIYIDHQVPIGYDYDNLDTGLYLGTGLNGFLTFNDLRIAELYAMPDIAKRIRFSAGADLDEVYPTASGDWSPREAAEYAEKVANEQWSQFEPDFTFEAYAVYLYENDDGTYFTEVALEKLYKGFNFNDGMISNDKGINDKGLYDKYWNGHHLRILFYGKEQLSILWNGYGIKSVVNSDPIEKIITPQTAMRIVSKELSNETVFSFSELSLRYVMEWDGEFINTEEVYRDPETAGQEHIARPMWIFKKYDADSSLSATSHVHMTMILVDAITGEMYSYLHTGIGY